MLGTYWGLLKFKYFCFIFGSRADEALYVREEVSTDGRTF